MEEDVNMATTITTITTITTKDACPSTQPLQPTQSKSRTTTPAVEISILPSTDKHKTDTKSSPSRT
jgi:hypothetical protein